MRRIVDVARDKPEFGRAYPALWTLQGEISLDYVASLKASPMEADPRHRDQPDPAGEGKTTTTVGLTDGLNHIGKKALCCLPRTQPWAVFWREGRRRWRRLRSGRADGGHQSPFHRPTFTPRRCEQSARRADRQSRLLGQPARSRHAPHQLAPRRRHERSRAAFNRFIAWRRLPTAFPRGRF